MMYAYICKANNIAIYHIFQQYFTCSNHEFAINIHILFMIEIKYCVIDYVDYKKRNTKFSRIQFTFQTFLSSIPYIL